MLISLLVLSIHLAWAQDLADNEISDEEGEEGVTRPISDEKRRERLRSFFTRRREESSPDSEEEEEAPEKKPRFKPRNRFVRPTAAKPTEVESDDSEVDDDDLEGFSQSVSVSQSVSTSVSTRRVRPITRIFQNRNEAKKEEEEKEEESETAEAEKKVEETPTTQRKRFRLVKSARRNEGSLVERLLKNFDQQNEVTGGERTRGRRIRFRPSVRRDQIRRKTQAAVDVTVPEVTTETVRPRLRLRGEVSDQEEEEEEELHDTVCQERETTLAETTVTTERSAVTGAEEEIVVITTEPARPIVTDSETQPPTPQILGNTRHCVNKPTASCHALPCPNMNHLTVVTKAVNVTNTTY